MKITAYNRDHNIDLSGSVGVTSVTYASTHTALGSNTPLVESGAGAPGSGPQAAAWDHVHPAAAGGASSFGSNSTRVSRTPSAGASSSNSRADHVHDGIGGATASGSNSLNTGNLNLRAGTGIALALSNTDGGTGFDTVTIQNIAAGGTGGSVSYASNSTRVAATAAAGASTLVSRADHVHDGIGTVTASGSNTLGRGAFNIRQGNNIAIGWTDSDGDGLLDTATIHSTASGSGGGGGSGPTDYVSGASGTGHITIPGIAVPDRVPASPSANDDEFDTTDTSDPMTGWTTLGTLDSLNMNSDAASHLHMGKTATGTFQMHGIYKAVPSMPFTVTAKLSDAIFYGNYPRTGLMLLEASPGKIFEFGLHVTSANQYNLGRASWTNRTTRSSFTDNLVAVIGVPFYLQMVVTSSSSVAMSVSRNGFHWFQQFSGINPGFTVGNVGLFITGEDNSVTAGAWYDWIRFA